MQFHGRETGEPDVHRDAAGGGTLQQRGHRMAAQGRFEGEIQPFVDCALQQPSALVPCRRVDLLLR